LPPRGGQRILSAMEVVFASRSMVHLILLGGFRQHDETLNGIVPGLFIVRVASFRRPLGAFHQQLCRHRDIVMAKKNIESYIMFNFPKSTLMVLLNSSAPLSKLVFKNEERFFYMTERVTCNVTGMVASLQGRNDGVAKVWSLTKHCSNLCVRAAATRSTATRRK
jgi:hypothetical protein